MLQDMFYYFLQQQLNIQSGCDKRWVSAHTDVQRAM